MAFEKIIRSSGPLPKELASLNLAKVQQGLTEVEQYCLNLFIRHNYDKSAFELYDRDERETRSTIFYRFLPKTSTLLEYSFGVINYDIRTNDSTFRQAKIGITGNPTSKLTTTIKAGKQWKDYDATDEEDINEFVNLLNIEKDNVNFKLRSDLFMLNDPKSLFSSILNAVKLPTQIMALVISERDSGNFLGTCGLISFNEDSEVECFYALLPQYRGNGFTIEAMLKLFEYAFSNRFVFNTNLGVYSFYYTHFSVLQKVNLY